MIVKINIIKPIEKKKLTYRDLKSGAFFFFKSSIRKNASLLQKTSIPTSILRTEDGHMIMLSETLFGFDSEVVLADVVIDVQVKE